MVPVVAVLTLLGGSWVVISKVVSRVTILTTQTRGLISPLITTTHEPPSIPTITSNSSLSVDIADHPDLSSAGLPLRMFKMQASSRTKCLVRGLLHQMWESPFTSTIQTSTDVHATLSFFARRLEHPSRWKPGTPGPVICTETLEHRGCRLHTNAGTTAQESFEAVVCTGTLGPGGCRLL